MAQGLGTTWKQFMSAPTNQGENTYAVTTFMSALTTYLNSYFAEKMAPSFMFNGVLTTPAGVSSPLIGKLGSFSTAIVTPLAPNIIKNNFGMDPFFKGFFKCIEQAINQGVYMVDVKAAGFLTPFPVKMNVSLQSYGELFDKKVKMKKPDNQDDIMSMIDDGVDQGMKSIAPNIVQYTGAGPGALNGAMTIAFI